MDYIEYDIIITSLFAAWVVFVILYVSKRVYGLAIRKKLDESSARYVSRKTIHILAAGVVAVLVPFVYKEAWTPFVLSLALTAELILARRFKMMSWFQESSNFYEVNFTVMWGASILIGWLLDKNLWLGVLPAIYMSIGDGVTGITRALISKKRHKGVEGSLAMLAAVLPFSLVLGYAGITSSFVGTLAEKQKYIDDNIAVPLASLLTLIAFKLMFPQLLKSLI